MDLEKKRGLSGQALKWIAAVAMLADHVGILLAFRAPYYLWWGLRVFGRIAFPLFCFLLVEGFYHTRDVKKYLLRLGIFALISEVPFDLFLYGEPVYWGYQNVMITLFIGLLLLYLYNGFLAKVQPIYALMTLVSMLCLAFVVRCDYGAEGVLIIFLFYFFRYRPLPLFLTVGLVMVLMGSIEPFAVLSFLPILFYSGEKGGREPAGETARQIRKYGFYCFYPAHMLILAGIRIFILQ